MTVRIEPGKWGAYLKRDSSVQVYHKNAHLKEKYNNNNCCTSCCQTKWAVRMSNWAILRDQQALKFGMLKTQAMTLRYQYQYLDSFLLNLWLYELFKFPRAFHQQSASLGSCCFSALTPEWKQKRFEHVLKQLDNLMAVGFPVLTGHLFNVATFYLTDARDNLSLILRRGSKSTVDATSAWAVFIFYE